MSSSASPAAASTARRPDQPLLSLAIPTYTVPTYNRAPFLAQLLEALLPQFAAIDPADAELIISDNSPGGETAALVAGFQQRGLRCTYIHNETNIESDGNFLQCLNRARGQYVWVMGDDDLVAPGALPSLLALLRRQEVDLVYLSSFPFRDQADIPSDPAATAALTADKLGRFAEVVTDGAYFLEKVNALLGLISVMLVNKNRLLATPHPPIDSLNDSNLIQMGWLFPLIRRRMSVLFVWQRLVAYRSFNSAGWGICEVFGIRLERIARQYFAADPALARKLMNGVLRYWMCDAVIAIRKGLHAEMPIEKVDHQLRRVFSGNWRYWLFVWPVAELPLPLARAAHAILNTVNRLTRIAQGLWRHWFHRGHYLRP